MKNATKMPLSIDDLKIESFVTSMDSELSAKLMGGLGAVGKEHETHTQVTKDHEKGHLCNTQQC